MELKTKKKIRVMSTVLFLLYLLALGYFLFFAEGFGRAIEDRGYRYNLEPMKEIMRFWNNRETLGTSAVLLNLAGNVLAFVPFGAILPVLNRHTRGFFRIGLLSLEFSFLMECFQLMFRVGSFDVDDMILNTLGGITGFLLFAICNGVRRRLYE
ncbi:MAG TPA: VanZ family protein [Candidatus Limivivens intestinipullorum]|uniref:VanZ family protein n=1 Tax=Candidatus Limivivens intestinipullorum TaxID=2840858 RepID=A0A9D1ET95_9FIRM|nr:VanZ family protein [Candidatus Limivivens intestinipullorum]